MIKALFFFILLLDLLKVSYPLNFVVPTWASVLCFCSVKRFQIGRIDNSRSSKLMKSWFSLIIVDTYTYSWHKQHYIFSLCVWWPLEFVYVTWETERPVNLVPHLNDRMQTKKYSNISKSVWPLSFCTTFLALSEKIPSQYYTVPSRTRILVLKENHTYWTAR